MAFHASDAAAVDDFSSYASNAVIYSAANNLWDPIFGGDSSFLGNGAGGAKPNGVGDSGMMCGTGVTAPGREQVVIVEFATLPTSGSGYFSIYAAINQATPTSGFEVEYDRGAATWLKIENANTFAVISSLATGAPTLAAGDAMGVQTFVSGANVTCEVYFRIGGTWDATPRLTATLAAATVTTSFSKFGIETSNGNAIVVDRVLAGTYTVASSIAAGTVASTAVARGVNVVASGSPVQTVGHISSSATVRGINLASAPLAIGTVPSTATVHGVSLTAGPATLSVGHVASAATVGAITVQQSGVYGTLVTVGRGIMDSQRSIVRDANNRVWIFAAEDRPFQGDTSEETHNFLRAYRADQTGIPSTFTERDTANRPKSSTATNTYSVPDVRLSSTGVVHMVWTDWNGALWYCTFDTTGNGGLGTWGTPSQLVASGLNLPPAVAQAWQRSHYSGAIAIDAADTLHVVYTAGTTVSYISKTSGGAWSGATTISTAQTSPQHPNLIATASGDLYAVWMHAPAAATSEIHYQQRTSGTWLGAAETVTTGALNNTDLDQTPGIALLNGTPLALYLDSSQNIQTRTRTGAGAWSAASGPGLDTHAPGLYAQGGDIWVGEGHTITGGVPDIQSAYTFKLAGQAWSGEHVLTQNADYKDGSAAIRYESHRRDPFPQYIDVAYMDEDIGRNATDSDSQHYAAVYYAAIQPAQIAVGTITGASTVRGVNVAGGAGTIAVGHVSSAASAHGVNVVGGGSTIALGHVASTATVRGVTLAAGPATLHPGTVAPASQPHGVNLTAGAAQLSLGHISSTATVLGVTVFAAGSLLQIGHVTPTAVARGVNLVSGAATLPLGHVTTTANVHGVGLVGSSTAPLAIGRVASAAVVRGVVIIGRIARLLNLHDGPDELVELDDGVDVRLTLSDTGG